MEVNGTTSGRGSYIIATRSIFVFFVLSVPFSRVCGYWYQSDCVSSTSLCFYQHSQDIQDLLRQMARPDSRSRGMAVDLLMNTIFGEGTLQDDGSAISYNEVAELQRQVRLKSHY